MQLLLRKRSRAVSELPVNQTPHPALGGGPGQRLRSWQRRDGAGCRGCPPSQGALCSHPPPSYEAAVQLRVFSFPRLNARVGWKGKEPCHLKVTDRRMAVFMSVITAPYGLSAEYLNTSAAEGGCCFRGRQNSTSRGWLCSPAQVGGISSWTPRASVSHPAACAVAVLGAGLLNVEVTIARNENGWSPARREMLGQAAPLWNKCSETGCAAAPVTPRQPLPQLCPPAASPFAPHQPLPPAASPFAPLLFGKVQKVPKRGQISLNFRLWRREREEERRQALLGKRLLAHSVHQTGSGDDDDVRTGQLNNYPAEGCHRRRRSMLGSRRPLGGFCWCRTWGALNRTGCLAGVSSSRAALRCAAWAGCETAALGASPVPWVCQSSSSNRALSGRKTPSQTAAAGRRALPAPPQCGDAAAPHPCSCALPCPLLLAATEGGPGRARVAALARLAPAAR